MTMKKGELSFDVKKKGGKKVVAKEVILKKEAVAA